MFPSYHIIYKFPPTHLNRIQLFQTVLIPTLSRPALASPQIFRNIPIHTTTTHGPRLLNNSSPNRVAGVHKDHSKPLQLDLTWAPPLIIRHCTLQLDAFVAAAPIATPKPGNRRRKTLPGRPSHSETSETHYHVLDDTRGPVHLRVGCRSSAVVWSAPLPKSCGLYMRLKSDFRSSNSRVSTIV